MEITTRRLGRVDYLPTFSAMREFTASRTAQTSDELWLCEHPAVYTQGLAGQPGHVLNSGAIPVIATDRGGQVTYHGPGQIVAYPLIDLRRTGYFVKEYVYRVEEAVIRTLAHFGVTGHRVTGAPGIYVRLKEPGAHAMLAQRPARRVVNSEAGGLDAPATRGIAPAPDFTGLGKIAALGIKVSRHCSYHGVALNVAMDLEPFTRINPCGYPGLQTVDLSTIGVNVGWSEVANVLGQKLVTYLAP